MEINGIDKNYQPPNPKLWTGRQSSPDLGVQYWHQAVRTVNFLEEDLSQIDSAIGLIGYACDEGVRRNKGRPGAILGPDQIKSRLAKLSYPLNSTYVSDFGNIFCPDSNLEDCQEALSIAVEHLIGNNLFPIILGGGHDVAYGHFKGIFNSFKSQLKPKIGIINFDAHFDLRPLENGANSGTPFFQIINGFQSYLDYFVIGIQRTSNTRELFEIAKENDVKYLETRECQDIHIPVVLDQLHHFVQQVDYLYLTIDLDGFSSAYAPGVSAPSPLGFSPHFVLEILQFLLQTQKVISCDIAEMNPNFDQDQSTAKLAALLVNWIVRHKS